ncbi:MAG TPA: hypothetical protein VF121_09690, partial [Thermoanaerobaculia bacterium]|nr:hypothetical protein [Thermoanaerobaculia bacterium]
MDWRPLDLLPGLYALALAGLLLAALRRWYDPVPPRVLAVFALVLLPLLGPVLFGGKVLLPLDNLRLAPPFQDLAPTDPPGNPLQHDLLQQIAPTQLAVRRALAAGRWPLWDPLVAAGMPLLADPQSQLLQPFVWLALPLPLAQAAGVTAFLRLSAALLFSFLLLRRQGLGGTASLGGALAYGLSGFLLLWLGWPIVNAAALLPAVLYAVVLCAERGARRDRLLLAATLVALLAGGHPETVLYVGAAAGAFFLARVLARPRGARLPRLATGAAAAAVALGIAALSWLPMLEHLPKSERTAMLEFQLRDRGWEDLRAELAGAEGRAAWRRTAVQRLLPVAAPFAFGDSRLGLLYWGEVNSNDNSTGFVGTAALLLALLAASGGRRFPQERLALGTLLASLLLLAQPAGLDALVYRLPLVGATAAHHNRRLLLLVAFCLAYLAACTVERVRRGELTRRWPAVLAWATLLALLIAWGYVAQAHDYDPTILDDFRRRWLWGQLAALGVAAALVLAAARGARARRWAPPLLAGLVAVELLAAHGPANPPMPRRLASAAPPPLAFLQERLAPGERIVGLGPALPPNLASLYGLADVRVYNPLTPMPYHHFVYPLTRSPGWLIPEFGRPRHPLYDLLGVRYALAKPGVRFPRPLRRVVEDPAGWVYERRRPLPRLFLPAAAVSAQAAPSAAWRDWLERNPNYAARALVERGLGDRTGWSAARPAAARLAITRLEPARLDARLRLPEVRLLASSVYQDGHWRLLADGRRLPTVHANGPFVGAWLPQGTRELALLYRPAPFVAGCALAALALAG